MGVGSIARRILPVVLFGGLAACDGTLPGTGLHETTVLQGALKIPAPQGYCIDPEASEAHGDAIVVLIGRCTTRGGASGGVAAALVSITVGGAASAGVLVAGPDALAQFFTSTAGRKVLARDGVAAHVVVLQAQVDKGSLLLHLNDQTTGEYWRAITAIKGRLVTISASGAEGAPLTPDQGLKLVRDELALLARRNPQKVMPAQ